ncbi:hypothetical protein [Tamlana sp. I1]|uniref:hypothetical protein n=1 Tax=Tamlana sp. I1 TaxID=2762061 RepID=UPI00188DFF5C|nr:hypothetical protein [Tamlana sp. I1]
MKSKIFISLITFLGLLNQGEAQEGLKENFNFKIGAIGAWVAYEKPLNDSFLIDAEIGYIGGILNSEFIFTTSIELEPRYYYNFSKRIQKGKNTINNSGNYFAVQLSYIPDIFTAKTPNNANIDVLKTFSAIPTFGLRRNITKGLNFDFEFGVGYLWAKGYENEVTANLLIGLSYVFKTNAK